MFIKAPMIDMDAVTVTFEGSVWRPARKTPGLRALAHIVRADRRYPSHELADIVWREGLPSYADENPRAALASAISDLRAELRHAGSPLTLLAERIQCKDGDWFFDRHGVVAASRSRRSKAMS